MTAGSHRLHPGVRMGWWRGRQFLMVHGAWAGIPTRYRVDQHGDVWAFCPKTLIFTRDAGIPLAMQARLRYRLGYRAAREA